MYDSMSSPAIFTCGNSPTRCPAMVPPNSQPDRSLSCDHVVEELLAGHLGVRLEEVSAGPPHDREVVAQAVLDGVVAQHEGASEVGLPPLEDRPEVAEHHVVVGDDPVRRVLVVGLQGVRAGPDDPLVPVPVDAEQVGRQVPDGVAGRLAP